MLEFDDGVHVSGTDVWLDPKRRKPRAVVTHAHSDHVGRHAQWVTSPGTGALAVRRWNARDVETHAFREPWEEDGARLTLLPAGHILGSSMVLVERAGTRILYTGDFRLKPSATAEPCEPVNADVLVMECTFGEPMYRFPDRERVLDELCAFLDETFASNAIPILLAYALGKAQEVAHLVAGRGYAIGLWSSAHHLLDAYRDAGLAFGDVIEIGDDAPARAEALRAERRVLIVPPDRNAAAFVRRFARRRTAFLSGWAMGHHVAWRPHTDAAFAISDHADFDELIALVEQVKPRLVYTLHGPDRFAGELRMRGWDAVPAKHARQMSLL